MEDQTHAEFIEETKQKAQEDHEFWIRSLADWKACADAARKQIKKTRAFIALLETWEVPGDTEANGTE